MPAVKIAPEPEAGSTSTAPPATPPSFFKRVLAFLATPSGLAVAGLTVTVIVQRFARAGERRDHERDRQMLLDLLRERER